MDSSKRYMNKRIEKHSGCTKELFSIQILYRLDHKLYYIYQ